MPLFSKILFHYPAGHVGDSLADMRHYANEFQRMKANRITLPVGWGHPFTDEKRSAKTTVGTIKTVAIARDGSRVIGIRIVTDLSRPDAIKAARANTMQLSPVIFATWRDGRGREYRDALHAVDFVPKSGAYQTRWRELKPKPKPATLSLVSNGVNQMTAVLGDEIRDALVALREKINGDGMSFDDAVASLFGQAALADVAAESEGSDEDDVTLTEPEFAALSLDQRRRIVRERRETATMMADLRKRHPGMYREPAAAR